MRKRLKKYGAYLCSEKSRLWLSASLVVFTILICNVLFMFYNESFYYSEYEMLGVYAHVPEQEARAATESMLDYLTAQAERLNDFFSAKERLHLQDVRQLVWIAKFASIIGVISAVALCYAYRRRLDRILIDQGIFMAGLIIAAFLLRTLFHPIFLIFHRIVFTNDFWLLDPATDRLILLLPEPFFVHATAAIFIRSLLLSTMLLLFGLYLKKFRPAFLSAS